MDSTTIWIIIAVVAILALFLYSRNRPAPRGAYDDRNARSSGSIGGGKRSYDDPNHRSSGSIGGGERAYNDPEHTSRGSIGGSPTHRNDQDDRRKERNDERDADDRDTTGERIDSQRKHDDEHFKSKGSIGG